MSLFKIMIYSFIIGISAIVPGLSGGVLAISLGIYPVLINSIINIRKNFRKSISFLLPFVSFAGLGMLVFGFVVSPLLENYEHIVIFLFIGLIIGSVPELLKESTKNGFKLVYLIPMIIAFIIGLVFADASNGSDSQESYSAFLMLAGGGVLTLGAIVPGISSSFILMNLGIYNKIISSFTTFDVYNILLIITGIIITFIATVKLINFAFTRFHGYAYFASFGFLISSVLTVYPSAVNMVDILMLIVGFIIIFVFKKLTKSDTVSNN